MAIIGANPRRMQEDAFIGYETSITDNARRYHGAMEANKQKRPSRGEMDDTVRTVTDAGGVQVLGILTILGGVTRGDSSQVSIAGKFFQALEQSNTEAAGSWTGTTHH